MKQKTPLLLGSTFPLTLVRRRVTIEPESVGTLRRELKRRSLASYWGHRNTLAAARALLGIDVAPETERPALRLDSGNYPMFNGIRHNECWVLSPEYVAGHRPAIGEEVATGKIVGWQVLKIKWTLARV